ncbi:MAG TPA: signal peptidase I [Clostridia bacterium]|nr:signal peptidase I [Clostridia bacterium]HRX41565.1 signal peptidase I [Clostridia bacterium]
MKNKFFKELLQWIEAIAIAIVLAILIRGFLFEPVIIEGRSMMDTLHDGDRVILNKISLAFNKPDYGDIVVIEIEEPYFNVLKFLNNSEAAKKLLPTTTGADYIKRVIAKAGDTVDIKDGYVYVNGERLEEPYLRAQGTTMSSVTKMPYTVEEGKYFVMGDNRVESRDSRSFGTIDENQIIGRTTTRVWPLYSLGKIDKAD